MRTVNCGTQNQGTQNVEQGTRNPEQQGSTFTRVTCYARVMRRFSQLITTVTLFAACAVAVPVSAQTVKGQRAIGVDGGILFPDEAFEKTVTLDAFGEYYATPNISVRGLLGWASPGFENFTENHFRQVHLLFNGVYSWNGNRWHPYATAGAGAYFLRQIFENAIPRSAAV